MTNDERPDPGSAVPADPPASPGAGPATPHAAGAGSASPPPPADPPPPGGGGPFTGAASAAGPPPGGGGVPRRRLRRSRDRKVVAGVAGGLGEYAGVDPIVFRVLFVVLSLFGGIGILLYLVAWLFLPDADEDTSPAESLIGRGTRSSGTSLEAVLLAIAAAVLAILLLRGDTGDLLLLAVVVLGAVLLLRNRDAGWPPPRPPAPPPPPPPPPPSYAPGGSQSYAPPPGAPGSYRSWGGTYPVQAGPGAAPTTPLSTVDAPAGTALPPYGAYGYGPAYEPPPPAPPKPPRERSKLGGIAISLAVVALGVLAALDAGGAADPGARHYLGLALGVLGLALLAGTWIGRARWLIWLGVPLTVALIATSTAEVTLRAGSGDRSFTPTSVAAISDRYELGTGNLLVDLSTVDFTDRDVRTTVHLGVGNLQVQVPREVDVTVRARSGVGGIDLFGDTYGGPGVKRSVSDAGPDGVGGGRLDLVVEVGIGRVEVTRATS